MSASVENTPSVGSGNPSVSGGTQKLSFLEKAGYGCADSAANFVFMTMVLFQLNFYTDVFGLTGTAAAMILLWPRLWDAVADPIVGVLADRTNTRWGKFRPWILFTTVPWVVVMILAYTTPHGWNMAAMIAYACITNMLLMTIYSMNNMPYAALGGVMTGNVNERASLNSYRFFLVNAAQFIVGALTLPLVTKFAGRHAAKVAEAAGKQMEAVVLAPTDKQYGWTMTMSIWAALCFVLFIITFVSTRERIKPTSSRKSSPKEDFGLLLKNNPWKVMWLWTLVHFAILSFRGGALYNYYHHYADKAAMFNAVKAFGLVMPIGAHGNALLEWLGYIVHGDASAANVADVFNSIINGMGTGLIMITILLSPSLAKRYGKKAVATWGFVLSTVGTFVFYFLAPANAWGMIGVTALISIVYAPTIPLTWAIFADVADYSEWKTGQRFTGMVFATIGFALKTGLALGSAGFIWVMQGFFKYNTKLPDEPSAVLGYRVTSGIVVGILFAICSVLLASYQLNKSTTLQMAGELEERRRKLAPA